mgnify:CR=1 FL=1
MSAAAAASPEESKTAEAKWTSLKIANPKELYTDWETYEFDKLTDIINKTLNFDWKSNFKMGFWGFGVKKNMTRLNLLLKI